MPRQTKEGIVKEPPKIQGMKPIGVPGKLLEQIILSINEYEAIRLCDYENFDHQTSAEKMGVSRPTFTRFPCTKPTRPSSTINIAHPPTVK